MGKEPVETLETGGLSVWDIKVNPETNDWGVAAIYDGYLFDLNRSKKGAGEQHSLS